MAYAGEGEYGILRVNGNVIGGFIQWGIGITISQKLAIPHKWKASARSWLLMEVVEGNLCEASFYKIQEDKEILLSKENVTFVCGSNERGKWVNSLFEMYKTE